MKTYIFGENSMLWYNFEYLRRIVKRVITYGTFDLLHWGHINILKKAKKEGDYLIVALSTDEFNKQKGKNAYHSFKKRKKMLESIRYVDLVIEENDWDQKQKDIQNYDVDIFVMGSDWENKFNFLEDIVTVKYLPRTTGISTSKIVRDLNLINENKKQH